MVGLTSLEIMRLLVEYEIGSLIDSTILLESLRMVVQERKSDFNFEQWADFIYVQEPLVMSIKFTPLDILQSRLVIRDMFEYNIRSRCSDNKEDITLNGSLARLALTYLNLAKQQEYPDYLSFHKLEADVEIQQILNTLALRKIFEKDNDNNDIHKLIMALILPTVNVKNSPKSNVPILMELGVSIINNHIEDPDLDHDVYYYLRTQKELTNLESETFKLAKKIDHLPPCTVYSFGNSVVCCMQNRND